MKIRYTALSETGLRRKENQDSLFCAADDTTGFFLVADGMGGHEDGSRASTTIKEKASVWWNERHCRGSFGDFLKNVQELKGIFSDANREIYCTTDKDSICGSTLVALWLEGDARAVFSCGDSRCYQAQKRGLKKKFFQLTTDDVWENQSENVAGMSREEIRNHKNFGFLVRAVGVEPSFQCSIQSDKCGGKTLFLLCSDGVYKYCSDQVLKNLSLMALQSGNLESGAENIRQHVFQNGAGDNLSLVLVMVEN